MKTFKLLLASMVFSCFFFVNDANAQGNPDKTEVWPFNFYCFCAGEQVAGEIVFNHHITPNGIEHYNAMSGKLMGQTTGETYRVIDSEHFGSNSGGYVFLLVGKNGRIRAEHMMYNSAGNYRYTVYCAAE